MKFIETPLRGAFVVEPTLLRDERGFFTRLFCAREFRMRGLEDRFVQTNHSLTLRKGTVRGLHYQLPPHGEAKLVRCLRGSIQDVIVDVRKESPTFLRWHGEVLTGRDLKMVYVPAGFAHGFQALEDDTEVTYQSSSEYTPGSERGVRYNDPAIGIAWIIPEVLVSPKDSRLPLVDLAFVGVA